MAPRFLTLAPVHGFPYRLVLDLCPHQGSRFTVQDDPLLALLDNYNKGDYQHGGLLSGSNTKLYQRSARRQRQCTRHKSSEGFIGGVVIAATSVAGFAQRMRGQFLQAAQRRS